MRRQASDDEKRLILFWVQTESIGEVAAMVIARVEHKPERLGFGDESYVVSYVGKKDLRSFRRVKDQRTKPLSQGVTRPQLILVC